MGGLKHQMEKRSMDYFAGLDVSVKETSICIVDDTQYHGISDAANLDTWKGELPDGTYARRRENGQRDLSLRKRRLIDRLLGLSHFIPLAGQLAIAGRPRITRRSAGR
jgi:hypothetical protein